MIRKGISPKGASPARRDSDRESAGLMEPRNSSQREDQSTSSLGASRSRTTTGATSSSWRVSSTLNLGVILCESDFNSIANCGSCFSGPVNRQFQYRCRLPTHRGKTPGAQFGLDVDYIHLAIKIDHINRKSHA